MKILEQWRTLDRFAGYYEASNLGRIRRARPGHSTSVGKILRPSRDRQGYCHIVLSIERQDFGELVHTLVAEVFIGPRPEGKEVNHKNAKKDDNRAVNLEYVTPLQNLFHARKLGLRKTRLTWEDILYIRREHKPRRRGYGCYVLAKKFGVAPETIRNVINRRTWI